MNFSTADIIEVLVITVFLAVYYYQLKTRKGMLYKAVKKRLDKSYSDEKTVEKQLNLQIRLIPVGILAIIVIKYLMKIR